MQKTYVLDTSVLVHDPQALLAFRGTRVAVPIFVVMELDELKTSKRVDVAAAARMATRIIYKLREFGSLHQGDGAYDPERDTWYRIITQEANTEAIDVLGALRAFDASASGRKMDGLIVQSSLALQATLPTHQVVLVSKDVNLRILAEFAGLHAEDYERDKISHDTLFKGFREAPNAGIQGSDGAESAANLRPEDFSADPLLPNEYIVTSDEGGEHVFRYHAQSDAIRSVQRDFFGRVGIEPRNVEQRMALDLLMDPSVHLVTLIGKAGTGKTFLALAAALAQMSLGGRTGYQRTLLSKPVVAVGQDVGFLPGDMDAKLQPWMTSFYDNLDVLIRPDADGAVGKGAAKSERSWEQLFESRQLEMQPLHTIRGRSIANAFMLIDEAQNLTPHELKTIITRAASGTKVVLAGDPHQVDNPFLDAHSNGLVYVAERLKGSPVTGTVTFSQGQRSVLAELGATLL